MRRTRRRMRRRTLLIGGAVLLFAGGTAAAIKLSKGDAEKIEEHTGTPVEDMTDEDLEQAMRDLNIKSMEITDDDRVAIEKNSTQNTSQSAAQPETTAPQEAPVSGPGDDYIQELEKLSDLMDRGIITQEEFEAKKKQLLGL